jgi:fermentation-respiration switch protein FrsA (DUF1100 family)
MALERRFVYRPVPFTLDWQTPPPAIRAENVALRSADGTALHAWWCPTAQWDATRGAVVYCHGNAGNLSHRAESILRWQQLLEQGVLIFDYPGFGRSSGRPSEAGCYAAGVAAYEWLVQNRGVAPERILLYGGSLGGAVAVELASRFPHRALVLVSAFTSIQDMARLRFPWLPVRRVLRHRFDNLAKIGQCRGSIFMAHGTADRIVPFAQGEQLFATARPPKEFFPMQDYDHQHTPGPEFYRKLRDFLAAQEVRASPN